MLACAATGVHHYAGPRAYWRCEHDRHGHGAGEAGGSVMVTDDVADNRRNAVYTDVHEHGRAGGADGAGATG